MPRKGTTPVRVPVQPLQNDQLVRLTFTGRFQWSIDRVHLCEGWIELEEQPGVRIWLPLDLRVEPIETVPATS